MKSTEERSRGRLLLEASILLEWILLVPFLVVALVVLFFSLVAANLDGLAPTLLAILFFGGLAALNYACWQLRPWALWARSGVAFVLATYIVQTAPGAPGLYVLAAERALQACLSAWLAVRAGHEGRGP